MSNKYDLLLFLLEHNINKVCDPRLHPVAQALLTGSDEEKSACLGKGFPNLTLLYKGCFNREVQWLDHLRNVTRTKIRRIIR